MHSAPAILRLCLFWVEITSGNHFPPNPHVWLQRKMKFSRNSFPVDQYLLLLHSYFRFNSFPERERERKREREERAQIEEREREKREPAINEGRGRPTSEKREPAIDEQRDRPTVDRRAARSSITIVDCAAHRTIAPISPPISLLPRDLIFSFAARSQFDWIR